MLEALWRYKTVVLLVLLASLAVYIYSNQGKDEDDFNPLDRVVVTVSAWCQGGLDSVLDGVLSSWERYADNSRAAAQNEDLRHELAELRRQTTDVDEVRRENRRLLSLLSLTDRSHDVRYVACRVIANATSSQFRSVRIDRGSDDGVLRGMGVVAAAGLVGRVMAVDKSYADVMLLSDTQSSIGIFVGRSRARGQLRGLGDAAGMKARIDYLQRSASVDLGDDVLTTGAGRVFPKGLLVGYVRKVNKTEHGLYQEAIVEPAAPLFALDEVAVVVGFGPEAVVELPASQPTSAPSDEEQPSDLDQLGPLLE